MEIGLHIHVGTQVVTLGQGITDNGGGTLNKWLLSIKLTKNTQHNFRHLFTSLWGFCKHVLFWHFFRVYVSTYLCTNQAFMVLLCVYMSYGEIGVICGQVKGWNDVWCWLLLLSSNVLEQISLVVFRYGVWISKVWL